MKWWQKIWSWIPSLITKKNRSDDGPIDVYVTLNGEPEKLIGRFKTQDDGEWEAQAFVARTVMLTGEARVASVRYEPVRSET